MGDRIVAGVFVAAERAELIAYPRNNVLNIFVAHLGSFAWAETVMAKDACGCNSRCMRNRVVLIDRYRHSTASAFDAGSRTIRSAGEFPGLVPHNPEPRRAELPRRRIKHQGSNKPPYASDVHGLGEICR